tara:strand:+ start:2406 stop:2852 length:447 start_codon:yes stop_codon:yes gene_type:complete
MTKPLTQEIAEKYGYNEEYFRGWTKKYVDSLNLDNLKFKPIENINLYLQRVSSGDDKYLLLDAGYIYLLSPNSLGRYTHFIPIEEPFDFEQNKGGSYMNGLYVARKKHHTYTTSGFKNDSYKIIGFAPFPKTGLSGFLNWKFNPLEVK